MPTEKAYWLNPKTGRFFAVGSHARWIASADNAREIGLPPSVCAEISRLNREEERDDIKTLAIIVGLIRIRDGRGRVAIEFYAAREAIHSVLLAVKEMLNHVLDLPGDRELEFGNLKYQESLVIGKNEFERKLADSAPIAMVQTRQYNDLQIEDLEKRLALLGSGDDTGVHQPPTPPGGPLKRRDFLLSALLGGVSFPGQFLGTNAVHLPRRATRGQALSRPACLCGNMDDDRFSPYLRDAATGAYTLIVSPLLRVPDVFCFFCGGRPRGPWEPNPPHCECGALEAWATEPSSAIQRDDDGAGGYVLLGPRGVMWLIYYCPVCGKLAPYAQIE